MNRYGTFALASLVLLGIFGLASEPAGDWDLFWQLQTGKYMVETRELLTTDTFSLAAEAPRIEHCWLHDLTVYGIFLLGGYTALSLWKGTLIAGAALLLGLAARVRGASFVSIFIAGVPAFLLTSEFWKDRPQLWTYLFFAFFLWVMERSLAGRRGMLWGLLPAALLWANLHAAAVLAVLVLLAYLTSEAGERWLGRPRLSSEDWRRLLIVSGAVLICGLITPYGPHLVNTLIHAPTLGEASGNIAQLYNVDWRPTSFARNPAFYYAIGIAGALLLSAGRKARFADILLLGGLAVMGLTLERHIPFLLLAMAAILPYYLDQTVVLCRRILPGAVAWAVVALTGGALVWLTFDTTHNLYRRQGFFATGLNVIDLPVGAAEFVNNERLPGNIFNSYEWGGYLMWTLYPELRVFWDSRQNSPQMFEQGLRVMWEPEWETILARFAVRTVVLKALSPDAGGTYPLHANLRGSPRWALVYADDVAMVFVRRAGMPAAWLNERELPKERMDDTLLAQARLFTNKYPWRYIAWWEMAQVLMRRNDRAGALAALREYLSRAPIEKRDPRAAQAFRQLSTAGT